MSVVPDLLRHMGGIPVTGSPRLKAGDAYFVSSVTGVASNDGKSLASPVATLDAALGLCTDNHDDVIYLLPRHAETITGAGGITLDKAGVSIIGLGQYDTRPAFLMDGADTVTMLVTSANCTIENVMFRAGHSNIVVFATVSAKGMVFKNCAWEQNAADENWLCCIRTGTADNAADGLQVIDCTYDSYDTSNIGWVDLLKDSRDVRIVGNTICGQFGVTPFSPIYSVNTEIHKNIFVADNIIHNLHNGDNVVGIQLANTASTGAIVRNLIGAQDATGETPVLAGAAGLLVAENYYSGVLGTASGYIYPGIDTA